MRWQLYKIDDGVPGKPEVVIDLVRIRHVFIVCAILLFGGLFSIGSAAWFALPEVISFYEREKSTLTYDLFYRSPLYLPAAVAAEVPQAVSVPVLLYHGEGNASNMPLGTFVKQLRALKENGWQTVTLTQFESYVRGETTLPDKSFLLTFDDGRVDTYYGADPVLEDLDYNAVMFVITGYSLPQNGVKPGFYLSEAELRNMARSGRWEIESHGDMDHGTYAVQSTLDPSADATTVNGHYISDKFWENDASRFETDAEFKTRVTNDLSKSKQLLEKAFGKTVTAYAYPFNDFGEDTINFPGSTQILDDIVPTLYEYAFYQTWNGNGDTFNYPRINNGPGNTAYMVKRIEPTASWSGDDLIRTLNEGHVKELPYRVENFSGDWVPAWGTVTDGSDLVLRSSVNTTGAEALLNGSGTWKDYLFSAGFSRDAGTSISLIARNLDNENNVVCAFSNTLIDLQAHVRGEQRVLVRTSHRTDVAGTIGMRVSGNSVSCLLNGAVMASGQMPASVPRQGGIGVQTWSKSPGSAKGELLSARVESITASP